MECSIAEFHSPLHSAGIVGVDATYSYPGLQTQVALSTHVPFAKHVISRLSVLLELAAHVAMPVTGVVLPRMGRAISG